MSVDASIQRAKARASILSNLDKAFASQAAAASVTATPAATNTTPSKPIKKDIMIDTLQELLEDTSDRTRWKLNDQLQGKVLLMENTKKLNLKPKRKHDPKLSNTQLKRLRASLSASDNLSSLTTLHTSWLQHMRRYLHNCKNEAQIQSRVLSAELVGANLRVVESLNASLVGVTGIVIQCTKNAFVIASSNAPPRKKTGKVRKARQALRRQYAEATRNTAASGLDKQVTIEGDKETWQRIVVLKEQCVCAVQVPCSFGTLPEGEQNFVMCVFHGHHYMPCTVPIDCSAL